MSPQTGAKKAKSHKKKRNGVPHADVDLTDDYGHVSREAVTLTTDGEMTWFAFQDKAATVKFTGANGSPFLDDTFKIPKGGSVSTGPAQVDADPDVRYKYKVIGGKGTHDPEVIIDN